MLLLCVPPPLTRCAAQPGRGTHLPGYREVRSVPVNGMGVALDAFGGQQVIQISRQRFTIFHRILEVLERRS